VAAGMGGVYRFTVLASRYLSDRRPVTRWPIVQVP
jgi:hypothetical protein